jgi:hypothetical protein
MYKMRSILVQLIACLFVAPALNYVPATGRTMAQMGANALKKTLWDRTLRESNTLDDIWNHLKMSVDVRMSEIEIPDTVFMQFQTPPKGNHRMVVGMTTPLKKAFQEGTDETMLGNEEQLELMHLTLRYNELKKAVAYRGWGIEFNDLESTGLYGTINPKFQKAWAEYRGRRIRETLMLTVASELTKAPINLKQQFNSNVFICNLAMGDQPTWSIADVETDVDAEATAYGYKGTDFLGGDNPGNNDNYIDELASKMLQASGTSNSAQAWMDVHNLADLELFVRTRLKLMPVTIGKKRGFLFIIPSDVASYLTNPARAGSMGSIWKDYADLSIEEQSVPGMLGRYRSLWFIEDERAPTLTVDGESGTYTLRPGFMQIGDNDERNANPWSSSNHVFEVGTVVGAGALAEWIVNPLAYAQEGTEYGQLLGKGSYMCGGIQLGRFDVDEPDDAHDNGGTGAGKTIMQRGSCMVLISRIPTSQLRSTSANGANGST